MKKILWMLFLGTLICWAGITTEISAAETDRSMKKLYQQRMRMFPTRYYRKADFYRSPTLPVDWQDSLHSQT